MTLCLVVATGTCVQAGLFGKEETPGERFRKAIERETQYCATHTIKPNNRRCDITKLQPADPLATEEGRFAHSIKIPNPVPEDSGYKPGMTSKEYFDHLCKTEAGEFIYKTVENVDGVYMMRPRRRATDYMLEHLYVMEDPYGHTNGEANDLEFLFVEPNRIQVYRNAIIAMGENRVGENNSLIHLTLRRNSPMQNMNDILDNDPRNQSQWPKSLVRRSGVAMDSRGAASNDQTIGSWELQAGS